MLPSVEGQPSSAGVLGLELDTALLPKMKYLWVSLPLKVGRGCAGLFHFPSLLLCALGTGLWGGAGSSQ